MKKEREKKTQRREKEMSGIENSVRLKEGKRDKQANRGKRKEGHIIYEREREREREKEREREREREREMKRDRQTERKLGFLGLRAAYCKSRYNQYRREAKRERERERERERRRKRERERNVEC